jgi:hypothetical protein
MALKTFSCAICSQNFPEALKDEHHKIPQSLGGPDTPDNLVALCKGDHQALHMIAYMILNTERRNEIDPTVMSLHPKNNAAQTKLKEYAAYAAKEMFLKKEIKKDQAEEIRTVVELPHLYLELLRMDGYNHPHANGKPRGVSPLIRWIVADYLAKKFPMKRDAVQKVKRK